MTSNGYAEYKEKFTFHQSGAITIPKSTREVALEMAIDLEIISWLPDIGFNYKGQPAHSSFWYSSTVAQDFLNPPIENKFGRQRIFFERHHAAIAAWEDFCSYKRIRGYFHRQWDLTQSVAGIPEKERLSFIEPSVAWEGFNEITLRECYWEFPFGTTFSVEIVWLGALEFTDDDGEIWEAKSKRTDDDPKDKGLPPSGTQPNQAPKSGNPYTGFPAESSASDLGQWQNTKGSSYNADGSLNFKGGINKPNSNNTPPDPNDLGLWLVEVAFNPPNAVDGCGVLRPAGEIRNFAGKRSDAWTFPDCNPRQGLSGFCFYQNGSYKGESYICLPSVVTLKSVTFARVD